MCGCVPAEEQSVTGGVPGPGRSCQCCHQRLPPPLRCLLPHSSAAGYNVNLISSAPSPLIWQPPGSGNYIDIVTASLHHLQAITLTLVTSSPIHEWLFRGIFVHWHRGLQEEALKILCLITCTKNYSIRLCSETWYRTWLQLKSALNKRNYEVDFFKNYKADLRQSHLLHFVKRLQT